MIGLLVTVVVSALASPPVRADWERISSTPTSARPYYLCPADGAELGCEAIADPTLGSRRRGPLRAGAITQGPDLEVSPALHGSGAEGGYSPENLRDAYDLPSETAGTGQTVAVVDAYDNPNVESDLDAYRSYYGLPSCTGASGCFRVVNEDGGSSLPVSNERWAGEISIDVDMVSAICPNCHILLVEASENSADDLANAENEAAALGASEISNSFIAPVSTDPAHAAAFDHEGVPITAGGGDGGYGTGVPADYPSVIAVGGTRLEPASTARGWRETVWYDREAGVGTGSGCSEEPKPAWQTDSGCPYRTANDVAAVADPNTPVSVYDSYEHADPWVLYGGTSVATPIVAAAMALANPHTRSLEGASALYLEAELEPDAFNEVTGSNGSCGSYLCEAGPSYNGPAGLGSLGGVPDVGVSAVTSGAQEVGRHEATLTATVEVAAGELERCEFQYGPTTAYGFRVPCVELPGSGATQVLVAAHLTRLKGETTYHFRIVAAAGGGAIVGADSTLRTQDTPLPVVVTEAPIDVISTSATLNGSVNPEGEELESCFFEYGVSTAYGARGSCSQSPGSGETPVAVALSLTNLRAHATYYFRIAARNAAGTSYGSRLSFETSESPVEETTRRRQEERLAEDRALNDAAKGRAAAEASPSGSVIDTKLVVTSNASVAESVVAVQADRAALRVTCTGPVTCKGKLTLTAKGTTRKGGKKHTTNEYAGGGGFFIAPGHTVTVAVALSAAGRSLLAAVHGRLSATLTILKSSPSPASTHVQPLLLVAGRARRR